MDDEIDLMILVNHAVIHDVGEALEGNLIGFYKESK
jgi:hypothetical protein